MDNGGRRKIEQEPDIAEFKGIITDKEKADMICKNIASLTEDYEELDVDRVVAENGNGEHDMIKLEDIVAAFREMKLPRGFHSEDPPRDLLRDAAPEFAPPLLILFNQIVKSGVWPRTWKEEQTRMIPKQRNVAELNHLRPIVLTPYFSKVLEHILRKLILEDVTPHLNKAQYGGLQGLSTNHYLASLYQDLAIASEKGLSSTMMCFDLSKAFNCICHQDVIEAAVRLGVRSPLVRLIASYLHQRQTKVLWNDVCSSPLHANGGSGQGTVWSALLFLMSVDGMACLLQASIQHLERGNEVLSSPKLFCDDLCLVVHTESILLLEDGYFNDRDGRIANYLSDIMAFCTKTGMRLNMLKTHALTYNYNVPRLTYLPGCLSFPTGQEIQIDKDLRLLGTQVQEDFRFDALARERRRAGLYATFQLARLREQGVEPRHLKIVYLSFVRSVTEYGLLPAYHLLLDKHWRAVESVQRRATRVILGYRQKSSGSDDCPEYDERLLQLKLERLQHRTKSRFESFILKTEFKPRFRQYYTRVLPQGLPRRQERPYLIGQTFPVGNFKIKGGRTALAYTGTKEEKEASEKKIQKRGHTAVQSCEKALRKGEEEGEGKFLQ